MSKLLLYWEKADWMSSLELAKELKRFYRICINFGVELSVIDGDGSIALTKMGFSFPYFSSLKDIINNKETYILLEPENAKLDIFSVPLSEFVHPSDATYVVWSEYGTINIKDFHQPICVHIETTPNNGSLWSITAASIVLYDRMIKI